MRQCPKCLYERQLKDASVHPGICPSCGIAYEKWLEKERLKAEPIPEPVPKLSFREWFLYQFFFMPSDRHESAFWGHSLFFVVFVVWGWAFILHGIDWPFISSSFLHNVNLPFHEYGHVMFSPFGELSMYLGGSIFQIMLPCVFLFYFSFFRRDNFPASLMLWWVGQNFIDVSPYIYDAPTRYLPLIGGGGIESHDWWNILLMTGQMNLSTFYAWLWFGIGAVLIIASQVWGGTLLYIELKGRVRNPPNEIDEDG